MSTEALSEPVPVPVDVNGLDVLSRGECLELIGGSLLGRVALSVGALPTILPINFRLVDEQVVFRTGAGSKLDAAARGAVIAFEVDAYDPLEHTGWSVVVTGIAHESPTGPLRGPILSTAIPRWAPSGASRVLFLSTDIVSGRRIAHHPLPAGGPGDGSHRSGASGARMPP